MSYFDYAANTPVDERVLETFNDVTKKYYANPNAFHSLGQEARQLIDDSCEHILARLNLEGYELILTSGATESNNLALLGGAKRNRNKGKHILFGPFEHNSISSVLIELSKRGYEIEMLNCDSHGLVTKEELASKLRADTILVSLAAVDSELGIIQPVQELSKLIHEKSNALFHVDASQAIGKASIDFQGIDLITISPHKFYGMNGSGALIKKKTAVIDPILYGGRSTTSYRPGTPNAAMAAAFDKALDLALNEMDERMEIVNSYRSEILETLKGLKKVRLNSNEYSIPSTINFSYSGSRADALVSQLEKHSIYLSAKSSCCPGNTPSKAVYSLSHDKARAYSSVRISLSHLNQEEEVEELIHTLKECCQ